MLSIKEINELIEKIDQSSIDEFSYESNGDKVTLKKNTEVHYTPKESAPAHPNQEIVKTNSNQTAEINNEEAQEQVDTTTNSPTYDYEIVSPMVGTFYSSPSPDKPAYVNQGDKVSESTIVCIVEAMKLFNEIEAEINGEITEVLAENGELVEYGQPLFRVKKV
ncbi:acetyl-CoA carboxylase biotin carboxyl carrier protein [Saliterribacillus persicus]|uniref:Biotin carboxyl carrier protein of acetyl-CoA carboxylase n=1 Tax=Saliterribacillus persicus TaxID=930114 RepID=A0A368XG01_9BACI|nr:acetyl-CoA carboxylase biotin carboxyl carrier protein [Saliterribacillus persicus]RCW65407.1 biotin carboxyl carrier protein [Saliterribacillus persicus]